MFINEYSTRHGQANDFNWNTDELHYYSFAIGIKRYNERYDDVEEQLGRFDSPNKNGIDEPNIHSKHVSCECRCGFDCRRCNSR